MTTSCTTPPPAATLELAPTTTPEVLTATPYHRLARLAQPSRWWRPLLVVVLAGLLFQGIVLVLALVAVVVALAVPGWAPKLDGGLVSTSMNDPAFLGVALLSIALLLPATLLAVRLVGQRTVGTLWSVVGRLRWRLLGRSAAVTAVMLGALQLVLWVVEPQVVLPAGLHGRLVAGLVLVLLLVPFQAAAEEVVFRGLLMQTVGAWLRHPAWAIVLPLPLFVIGHTYSAAGLVDVAVFAAAAGYLTWRTGGLEAAIGLHVVNNVGAFALALLTGADLDATEVATSAALLSISYTLATAALVLALHRRGERVRPPSA